MLGVRLDAEVEARLSALAEKTQRSKSHIAKQALLRYLDAEEAREQERKLLDSRWREYQESGEVISQQAMDEWLDTWGDDKEKLCPAN